MTDKAIVICVVLAALAVIAFAFVRRAMRYRKALGAAVPPTPEEPSFEECMRKNKVIVNDLLDKALGEYYEKQRNAGQEPNRESEDEPHNEEQRWKG